MADGRGRGRIAHSTAAEVGNLSQTSTGPTKTGPLHVLKIDDRGLRSQETDDRVMQSRCCCVEFSRLIIMLA